MVDELRLIYASENGDRWLLCQDRPQGKLLVRHVPNASSGGQVSDMDADAFLAMAPHSPQNQALRQFLKEVGEASAALARPTVCPITQEPAMRTDGLGDFAEFDCPTCGRFRISRALLEIVPDKPELLRQELQRAKTLTPAGHIPLIANVVGG